MPLINFQTDLTNLPWGKDRRDGGSSKQPYITKDIPQGLESDDLPVRSGPDFIVRGGLKVVSNTIDDVSRLTQMFFDTKSPKGFLFIAKENVLSRTSVKTQAGGLGYGGANSQQTLGKGSFSPAGGGDPNLFQSVGNFISNALGASGGNELVLGGGGGVNQGIYLPTSTLLQTAGSAFGSHLNLLGLDPTANGEGGLFPSAGLTTYYGITKDQRTQEGENQNRLNELYKFHVDTTSENSINVYSYSGGPGSVLGIGNTNLLFADQRTGNQNLTSKSDPNYFYVGSRPNNRTTSSFISPLTGGASGKYEDYTNSIGSLIFPDGTPVINANNGFSYTQNFLTSVSQPKSFLPNPEVLYRNDSITYDQQQLISKDNVIQGGDAGLYPTDFRKQLYTYPDSGSAPTNNPKNPTEGGTQNSSIISISPNYRVKNIDERLNMGHPGNNGGRLRDSPSTSPLKNVWNYGINATELEALDKITAMPMYTKTSVDTNQPVNDLVKFRIAAINNNKTNDEAVYMHFRAFIDSFDDSYSSTWNSVNYVGRGDTLYNYGGFTRNISLSFTVAAQSKAELIPMYKKLNYLASQLTPDYNGAGFMRGNLVRLTLGGYLYEQPGFINSLTYTVPQESNWEIGIDQKGDSDHSVKELPHVIQVSGFSFTPIHKFLPEKPGNANNPNSRFIALSNKKDNRGNYIDEYKTYQPTRGSGGDNNEETNEPFPQPQNLS